MGLDTSHNAFNGAYSAFNRFRQAIAAAMDGSFPPHYDYLPGGRIQTGLDGFLIVNKNLQPNRWYFGEDYDSDSHPGLYELLTHSDCDGEISPENCALIAAELTTLLPKITALGWNDYGHITRDGGYTSVVQKFIDGCKKAAAANEPLEFM